MLSMFNHYPGDSDSGILFLILAVGIFQLKGTVHACMHAYMLSRV